MIREKSRMRKISCALMAPLIFALALSCAELNGDEDTLRDRIKLPPGFQISVYAENVPNARYA